MIRLFLLMLDPLLTIQDLPTFETAPDVANSQPPEPVVPMPEESVTLPAQGVTRKPKPQERAAQQEQDAPACESRRSVRFSPTVHAYDEGDHPCKLSLTDDSRQTRRRHVNESKAQLPARSRFFHGRAVRQFPTENRAAHLAALVRGCLSGT